MTTWTVVFDDVTTCNYVDHYQRFGETCFLQ